MFEYIRGKLVERNPLSWIVEVGCFALEINITPFSASLQTGAEVLLYLRSFMKENGVFIFYGFLDRKERLCFDLLCTLRGINHRKAFKLLSRVCWKDLVRLVLEENRSELEARTNLASTTVSRLILELKPRFVEAGLCLGEGSSSMLPSYLEAREALAALGYSSGEVKEVLDQLLVKTGGGLTTEELVKEALRFLGGQG
jgi:Holliday junction DNA helicase RuvA